MSDKISVCLVAPVPPPYGGIANWYNLVTHYVENNRINIKFLTVNIAPSKRTTEGRSLFERVVVSGIEMLRKKKELKEVIKKRPQVVHFTTSGQLAIVRDILLLQLVKKNKIPTIYHIRFGRTAEIAAKNTIEWKLLKKAIELSSITIAIDKTTEKVLRDRYSAAKVKYIPNPFDEKDIEDVFQRKQRENTNSKIVFLGWVIKTKGIEELLEAWEKIKVKHKLCSLWIIGPASKSYVDELKNRYSCERVYFIGELDHKAALEQVANSEIFILPSYTEGFPNSILEAMALKIPVIATKVGAIPDMLSGECGLLIDPKSSEQISYAINFLLENTNYRQFCTENAYKKIINEYTIQIILNEYKELWQSTKAI